MLHIGSCTDFSATRPQSSPQSNTHIYSCWIGSGQVQMYMCVSVCVKVIEECKWAQRQCWVCSVVMETCTEPPQSPELQLDQVLVVYLHIVCSSCVQVCGLLFVYLTDMGMFVTVYVCTWVCVGECDRCGFKVAYLNNASAVPQCTSNILKQRKKNFSKTTKCFNIWIKICKTVKTCVENNIFIYLIQHFWRKKGKALKNEWTSLMAALQSIWSCAAALNESLRAHGSNRWKGFLQECWKTRSRTWYSYCNLHSSFTTKQKERWMDMFMSVFVCLSNLH